jgi:hypothetical protein
MRHWQHAKRIGRVLGAVVTSLGLALAWMGCEAKETALIDSELFTMATTEDLTRDAQYMGQLFKQRSNGAPFLSLDLTDQRQYTFVIHRLLHAGKTPANSPRLFQRLREIRAGHATSFRP